MSNPTLAAASGFDAGAALRRVVEASAVGIGLAVVHAVTGWGIGCPLRETTGLWCPACGGTRMASAMLRGRVVEAFWWNPFAFALCAGVAVCALAWGIEWRGGPAWRPLARWAPITQSKIYWVLGVVAAVFTVVRNVPHWPPTWPW